MEFPNRIGMKSARKALFCQALTQSTKPYFVATSRSPWPETIIILVFCNCECHKSGILVESNCILVAANCIFIVSNKDLPRPTIIFWSITFLTKATYIFSESSYFESAPMFWTLAEDKYMCSWGAPTHLRCITSWSQYQALLLVRCLWCPNTAGQFCLTALKEGNLRFHNWQFPNQSATWNGSNCGSWISKPSCVFSLHRRVDKMLAGLQSNTLFFSEWR